MTGAVDGRAPAVRRTRRIPASPREVYEAWLDPAMLQRWMAPGFDVARAEVDARVGGHLRVWHTDGGADVGGFECEIVELVPYERLVFRWGFCGPQRTEGPVYDSRLTITLHAAGTHATELTLVHEHLDGLGAVLPEVTAQVDAGWSLVLEQLAGVFAPAPEGRR